MFFDQKYRNCQGQNRTLGHLRRVFDRKFGILKFRRCQGQNNSFEWCSDMKIHEIFGKYDVEFAVY